MRRVLFLMGFLCLATSTALAQDPVKVAPNNFKVLLDNDHVRVLEFRSKPGEKVGMHSHPDCVIYGFTGGKTKFTSPDGKTEERQGQAGTATWRAAETHASEFLGPGDAHVLLIELKGKPGAAKPATPKPAKKTPM